MFSEPRSPCIEGGIAGRHDAPARAAPRSLSPLMLGIASAFALMPPDGNASNLIVNNCLDDGSIGSLRYQVDHAAIDDIIDLSTNQLTCSAITLTLGEIHSALDGLTFQGPSDRAFVITNNSASAQRRIFDAEGSDLRVYNLTLSGGYYYGSGPLLKATGGCITSTGNVRLRDTIVSGCYARTYSNNLGAYGGGVYGFNVYLTRSRVVGNRVYSLQTAFGGGVAARNKVVMSDSTISANLSLSIFGKATGGGVKAPTVVISNSTIDSNKADSTGATGGGIWAQGTLLVDQSTISGNSATSAGGGAYLQNYFLLRNSTIAFNTANHSAGIYVSAAAAVADRAYSSIIARNIDSGPSGFADLFLGKGLPLAGANNLVISFNVVSSAISLTSDPQLSPLANHGGLTRTHAPLATSPAVDQGSNSSGNFSTDQRELGFAREVPTGSPDIGAYERQVADDEIYYGGFGD